MREGEGRCTRRSKGEEYRGGERSNFMHIILIARAMNNVNLFTFLINTHIQIHSGSITEQI